MMIFNIRIFNRIFKKYFPGLPYTRWVIQVLVVLIGLMIPTPAAAVEVILPSGSEIIPLEDTQDILKMQYPQRYPPPILLPDLRTLAPGDLQLEILRGSGVTRLRFSNTILNSGSGPLELRGLLFSDNSYVKVTQQLYRSDGTSVNHQAGSFFYHDVHGHWHWEGFSIYQVWSVTDTGNLDQLLVSSDKVGYCLIDVALYQGDLTDVNSTDLNPPESRQYAGCTWSRQGLSPGWTDTYRFHIAGQYVDITDLPDEMYALVSIVDPDGVIQEADYNNNDAIVYFRLNGNQLEVLGERFPHLPPGFSPR
jgi:hypothetical protein